MSRLKHATAAVLEFQETQSFDERARQLRAYRDTVIEEFMTDVYERFGELEPILSSSDAWVGAQLVMRELVRLQDQWMERL